jgi:glycosyltransferase involved in cell wall biosynthesis
MSKKILFFSGGAYISGMEVVTLHLMKGLKENGYEVRCIFSGWNDGNFKRKLDEIGVPNYAVKIGWIYIRKPLWTLDSLIHYPRAYYACKEILKSYDPDICQFCNFSMSIMLYGLIKHKSVYNLQETHEPNIKHRLIYKLINRKVSYFTAVSNHIVRVLEDLAIDPQKIKLIYNGIPSVEIHVPSPGGLQNRALQFAVIGQVARWKGHQILVAAVDNLVKNGTKDFKVLIYGNDTTEFGDEIKLLIKKKELENYFQWNGFVQEQDLIYKHCDVVVVPSLSGEPCSLTIIESMTRAKALIVSNSGGNRELVDHQENGLIYKADNPIELSMCMRILIDNKQKIVEYALAATAKAKKEYTYKKMTSQYIELYKSI